MKKVFNLVIVMLLVFSASCAQETAQINNESSPREHSYEPLTIPDFFSALISNHLQCFYQVGNEEFRAFCQSHDLDETDSHNINNYFTMSILHDLFTAQTAANYSRGEILYIPYLWHWVSPNPRHELYFVENDRLLSNENPTSLFANYQTYADIDRTPYLFLSDLVLEQPKYYSARGGSFSSFGWCSEREMAFIALTTLMNYNGKIVASGNHSWSELLISMIKKDGSKQQFTVKVDNTFNALSWATFHHGDAAAWYAEIGTSNLAGWYNRQAKSPTELEKIRTHIVTPLASGKIDAEVVRYLSNKL